MPGPFPRSLRALSAGSAARSSALPVALAALAGAWAFWFVSAQIPVYAVSDRARLEVTEAVRPVEASLDGRIETSRVVLGAEVRAGDPLIELDAGPLRLELAELRAVRDAREAELGPLSEELAAHERQLADLGRAAAENRDELAAGVREETAAITLAEVVLERSVGLEAQGLLSQTELARARFELERHQAGLARNRSALERLEWDRRAQASELSAKLAEGRRRRAAAEGERAIARAAILRVEDEIERRTIRAPASGRLGETADLRPGQWVARGTRIAAVVPQGGIQVVAAFRPGDALGRIRAGQSARFRLDGFPWTEYGFVRSRVSSLASEALSGSARIESSLADDASFPVALQHGWPGTLEIEVERVSPAVLVLRASGALLARDRRLGIATDEPAVTR